MPAELDFRESTTRYIPTDWEHEQRAEPLSNAVIRYLSTRSPSPILPDFLTYIPPRKTSPMPETLQQKTTSLPDGPPP